MIRKGFTLLEVLLSVTVMASGVLTVVILYSLGFRETRQSREDVASAAYADAVMSPLVNAASLTNLKWSVFKQIGNFPNGGDKTGWACYYQNGKVLSDPTSMAQGAFSSAMGALSGAAQGSFNVPTAYPSANGGLKAGLIVMHDEESAVIKIGFRAARDAATLMSAPMYYTEVHFQGIPD